MDASFNMISGQYPANYFSNQQTVVKSSEHPQHARYQNYQGLHQDGAQLSNSIHQYESNVEADTVLQSSACPQNVGCDNNNALEQDRTQLSNSTDEYQFSEFLEYDDDCWGTPEQYNSDIRRETYSDPCPSNSSNDVGHAHAAPRELQDSQILENHHINAISGEVITNLPVTTPCSEDPESKVAAQSRISYDLEAPLPDLDESDQRNYSEEDSGNSPKTSPAESTDASTDVSTASTTKEVTPAPTTKEKPKKKRSSRTVYTTHQQTVLENYFFKIQYLNLPQRTYLASTLDLTQTQIKVWFQNKRSKVKKLIKKGITDPKELGIAAIVDNQAPENEGMMIPLFDQRIQHAPTNAAHVYQAGQIQQYQNRCNMAANYTNELQSSASYNNGTGGYQYAPMERATVRTLHPQVQRQPEVNYAFPEYGYQNDFNNNPAAMYPVQQRNVTAPVRVHTNHQHAHCNMTGRPSPDTIAGYQPMAEYNHHVNVMNQPNIDAGTHQHPMWSMESQRHNQKINYGNHGNWKQQIVP